MPVGVTVNCLAVLTGGILGGWLGRYIPIKTTERMMGVLGLCSFSIGVLNLMKVESAPPVILAVLLGYFLGDLADLEKRIAWIFGKIFKKVPVGKSGLDMDAFVMAVVLFCASGFGIFGVLTEGLSGDSSVLLSKSFLDFFTALIFAVTMGMVIGLIAVPQYLIFLLLFVAARAVGGYLAQEEITAFVACGGILTMADGLRVAQIKYIAIGNMVPALILVIPLSYWWRSLGF